jgi:hypothetical protein
MIIENNIIKAGLIAVAALGALGFEAFVLLSDTLQRLKLVCK